MPSYFSLLRQHGLKMGFANFLGYLAGYSAFYLSMIILVLPIILMAGGLGIAEESFSSEMMDEIIAGLSMFGFIVVVLLYLGLVVFSVAVSCFLNGGIYGMGAQILRERVAKIGTYFSQGLRFMWRLTGQYLLMMFILLPLYIPVVGIIILEEMLGESPVLMIFAIFFMFILFIFASLFYLIAPAILVHDDLRVWESIKRAFHVVFRHFGHSLLSVLLAGIILIGLNFVYLAFSGVIMGLIALLQFILSYEVMFVIMVLVGIPLALMFIVFVLPLSVAAAQFLVQYRYEKRIRFKYLPQEA